MENPRGNCAPALPGMVWYGMERYGCYDYGMVVYRWYGMVGMVWYGMTWYGTMSGMVWWCIVGMVQPPSQGKQTMLTPLPLLRVRLCCT